MAEPSKTRNFFGKFWDRATPGVSNYNPSTGQFSHTGSGIAQVGARVLGLITGNPLIGTLASRGIGAYVNHGDRAPSAVRPEGIQAQSPGYTTGYQGSVITPSISNLGLGAQSPGSGWQGYMQGQGSVNNFGNQQFGSGMATQAGGFSPYSQWGQQVAAAPASQGSLGGFGNNVGGFLGGGRATGGQMGGTAGLTRSGGSASGWKSADIGSVYGAFTDPNGGDWTAKYERAI